MIRILKIFKNIRIFAFCFTRICKNLIATDKINLIKVEIPSR